MKTREKAQEKYKEFKPEEGERILVGLSNSAVCEERIFVYINKAGIYMCVHRDDEDCYEHGEGCFRFRVSGWTHAKPMPPKIPEFIKGDPVIILDIDGLEGIRIVNRVDKDGVIWCFPEGMLSGTHCTPWDCYEPLPNYDYGGRNVFGI